MEKYEEFFERFARERNTAVEEMRKIPCKGVVLTPKDKISC